MSNSIQNKESLFAAVVNGRDGDLEELLRNNGDLDAKIMGKGLLHTAVLMTNMKAVEILLNHKVNIDQADDSKNTPLHYAIRNYAVVDKQTKDQFKFVPLLIERKADVNFENKENATPFDLLALKSDKEMIKKILKMGSYPDLDTLPEEVEELVKPLYEEHKRAFKNELMREVIKNPAPLNPVPDPMLPFPTSGGHHLLFQMVVDYTM